MGRPWRDSDGGRQGELLRLDAGHALAPEHPARVLIAQVAAVDLSEFTAAYRADGRGRPPFHPRVMVALLLYCHGKGLVSPREVADACRDDLGARLITGNQFPDRRTIGRFLSRNRQAWMGLLPQTLAMGAERDLVDVSVVAGDGTSLQANAAMNATLTEQQLADRIDWFRQRLDTALADWQATLAEDRYAQPLLLSHAAPANTTAASWPKPPAGTSTGQPTATSPTAAGSATTPTDPDQAWRRVSTLWNKLRDHEAALALLRSRPSTACTDWEQRFESDQARVAACQARLDKAREEVAASNARRAENESTGAKIPGRRPVPVEQHNRVVRARAALKQATARAQKTAATRPITGRINTTDPASLLMPAKHGGFDQLHNIEALACKRQFIIAIGPHNNPNDKKALIPLLEKGRANLDRAAITDRIGAALFDNGFASAANFTANLPVDLLLVAVEKECRQTGRLNDATSNAAHAWQDMADLLAKPENAALYKRRAAIIEPLFAQLIARFGRRIHVRDEDVEALLHVWAVAHNLRKIARHDQRAARPG